MNCSGRQEIKNNDHLISIQNQLLTSLFTSHFDLQLPVTCCVALMVILTRDLIDSTSVI